VIRAAGLTFRERVLRGAAVQVVAFRLGGELHACDVALVEEVVSRRAVHPLPDVPDHLVGMLSLRGELLPVLDVAPLLGLVRDATRPPVVIVCETREGRVGVAAEGVDEVVDVPADAVRPAPHGAAEREGYVAGVARLDGALVNLIDLAEMLRDRTTQSTGQSA
jgi:purine-binding chemotaxis protein CheW